MCPLVLIHVHHVRKFPWAPCFQINTNLHCEHNLLCQLSNVDILCVLSGGTQFTLMGHSFYQSSPSVFGSHPLSVFPQQTCPSLMFRALIHCMPVYKHTYTVCVCVCVCVCVYDWCCRYGQLSGMVEPLAGLFGTIAVVVSPILALHYNVPMLAMILWRRR